MSGVSVTEITTITKLGTQPAFAISPNEKYFLLLEYDSSGTPSSGSIRAIADHQATITQVAAILPPILETMVAKGTAISPAQAGPAGMTLCSKQAMMERAVIVAISGHAVIGDITTVTSHCVAPVPIRAATNTFTAIIRSIMPQGLSSKKSLN